MSAYRIEDLQQEPLVQYRKLAADMFRTPNPCVNDRDALMQKQKEYEQKHGFAIERLGALYENRVYAGLEIYHFTVNFDGHMCKMGGIGGVISDFEKPFGGAMQALFAKAFERMHENGQIFTHLYPYEENYYRQYGYEVSSRLGVWTVPVEKIGTQTNGVVKRFEGTEDQQADIRRIFEAFSAKRNMQIDLTEAEWQGFFNKYAPYTTQGNKLIHYNEAHQADAFCVFTVQEQGEKVQNIEVNPCWFADLHALQGLLASFKMQRPYVDKVLLSLPAETDLGPMVDSCGKWGKRLAVQTLKNKGMSRCVDVESVLRLAKTKGEGQVCLAIENDIYCPWNNGTFTVTFGKENTVTKGGEPDMILTPQAFSAGILGRSSLEELGVYADTQVLTNEENLEKLFYKKSVFTERDF